MDLRSVLKRSPPARLPRVLSFVDTLIMNEQVKNAQRDQELDHECEHIREAVRYAKTLALKRHLDPDLAGIVAALENIGRIMTGTSAGHAEAGYLPAKELLTNMGCFSAREIEAVATAVRNHSRKEHVDAPLDEVAKDVDVYARYLQGNQNWRQEDLARLRRVRLELEFR